MAKGKKDIFAHFPKGFTPRETQKEILPQLEEAFKNPDVRFIILEAPPGVGKSHLAVTALSYFETGYIATASKLLQAQYTAVFKNLAELKGRQAFTCDRVHDTCAEGGLYFTGGDACGMPHTCKCPYKEGKKKALTAPMTVANYHVLTYNSDVPSREILVCDECHDLEKILMDYVSVEIKGNDLPVPAADPLPVHVEGTPLVSDPYFEWMEEYAVTLDEYIARGSREPEVFAKAQRLFESVDFATRHREKEEWIVELHKGGRGFTLKPLTVSSFSGILFRFGKKVLLMSATILDVQSFMSSVGIPSNQARFIQAPCPFPVENRLVYVGNLPMTYRHRETSWPAMTKTIDNILTHHKNDKGLILTPSNEMIQFIVKQVSKRNADRLLMAYGETRTDALRRHLESKLPTVLIASGFWEGLDLKDDASRFQILPSLPRAHWSGQTAARAKIDPQWYRWRTLTQLVQGVGRSVRSETDKAVTYVLDKDLRDEANKTRTMLPEWFLQALRNAG